MGSKFLKKLILTILFTLVFFGGAVLAIGGYFGFIPYANKLFGSDKPRDLGIRFAPGDTLKAQEKVGVKLVALPKGTPVTESIKLKGKKPASYTMSSAEISALANNRPWKYYPLSNVQIKINTDNAVEVSGMLDTVKLMSYAQAIGFDLSAPKEYMNKYHVNLENMPFYIKGTGNVTEGKVALNFQRVELGRLSLPSEVLSKAQAPVISFVETFMSKAPGFYAKRLEANSGKLIFEGSVPEEEATVNN
jgi:hypothetical protein